jgi:putative transposase
MKQRYGEEQIIAILHEAEALPTKPEIYRKYGISEQTYYCWRQLYGGLDVPHLRRLKQLEAENARLKRWWRSSGPRPSPAPDSARPWRPAGR